MFDKHPLAALMCWFPPIYLLGIVRNYGEPWCTKDGGFFPISSPLPVLWWPTKLYQHKKYERQLYGR